MAGLTVEAVLKEKQTTDADSITAVSLTHKALSNVSCLGGFINLERLDLTFNNLISLEGLALCVNLKWLSVVENKLRTLKGVEGLTKLTVLNAGKNKLRSMGEVENLVNLRALILNDNDIGSMGNLDKLKDLNTLVLSRNPIREFGRSLARLKSVTKISLSNCELEGIDSSIKGCAELKELRLGHNLIGTLPAELAYVTKLQNLDLGNNLIKSWKEMKVLSSLQRLKNLNLQGNPIAEKDKLVKKINKLVPGLRVYNNKPMEKYVMHANDNEVGSHSVMADKDVKVDNKMIKGGDRAKIKHATEDAATTKLQNLSEQSGQKLLGQNEGHIDEKGMYEDDRFVVGKKRKSKTKNVEESGILVVGEKEVKQVQEEKTDDFKKKKNPKESLMSQSRDGNGPYNARDGEKEKKKKKKVKEDPKTEALDHDPAKRATENNSKRKAVLDVLDIIDDGETPFSELLAIEAPVNVDDRDEKRDDKGTRNAGEVSGGVVILPAKRRKTKNTGAGTFTLNLLTSAAEVGLGGPSAWGDE
ncbi:hypothetical protein Dimus_009346 [Dionaea muscipula]